MAMLLDLIENALDFSSVLNTSIAASWLVLAVVLLRLVFKKAPKWTRIAMWGLVAFRLVCPFSMESTFSLIPSAEVFPQEILRYEGEQRKEPVHLDLVTNPIFLQGIQMEEEVSVKVELAQSADRVQIHDLYLNLVWWGGMVVMLLYAAISYGILLYKVQTAVRWQDNIFQSEHVKEPFVLGFARPRIFFPFQMAEEDIPYVLAHEQAHISRKDNWWKPFGFILLTVHWFNPVMWLAYVLFCRDIELACDEKVIKKLGRRARADYSKALLACSSRRRGIAACPVAFGEVSVKERVKNVLNYKKPGLLLVWAAILAGIIVAVCFLTDPVTDMVEAKDAVEEVNTEASGFVLIENENYKDVYSDTYITSFSIADTKEWTDCKIYVEQWYDGQCVLGVPYLLTSDTSKFYVRMRISMEGGNGEVTIGSDKAAGECVQAIQIPDAMSKWQYETYDVKKELPMGDGGAILALLAFDDGSGIHDSILNEAQKQSVDAVYTVIVRAVFEQKMEQENLNQDSLGFNEVVLVADEFRKAAYTEALERIAQEHISPDNQEWSATGITQFAVYDIDFDGREELMLFRDDGSMAGMGFYIYDYNEKKNMLYQELAVFPSLKFYDNGMVEAMASHNHGMAPGYVDEDFWPYSLYQYNPKTDVYDYVLNVDAWEKMYSEKAWTGEVFPDKADFDGDGILYYIMTDGEYNYDEPVDGAEYRKWRASILGELLQLDIPFIQLPNIMPEAAG